MTIRILFWINISLFILHEMDAIKTHEWKMMIFMNRLSDNVGHVVFTSLHFPLFMLVFYFMDNRFTHLFLTISVLLIVHQFVHILFRKHTENRMNNIFSKTIIFLMFADSCVSLVYYHFRF